MLKRGVPKGNVSKMKNNILEVIVVIYLLQFNNVKASLTFMFYFMNIQQFISLYTNKELISIMKQGSLLIF